MRNTLALYKSESWMDVGSLKHIPKSRNWPSLYAWMRYRQHLKRAAALHFTRIHQHEKPKSVMITEIPPIPPKHNKT